VQQVLDRMAETFALEARARGLRLVVRPHPGWVRSDPVLLERIVANLVGNALRYTRRGGVLAGCRRRGRQLRIEVWDSGVGIPPDQHERIFGEFVQIAPPGHLRGEGLGLGLAIVARLAQLLGHELGLRSSPGRGSCFAVTLPEASTPALASGPATSDHDTATEPLRGHAVLVIDNDPDVLASTGGLLRRWGLQVRTAASLAEVAGALEPAAGAPPDLVIADLHLGDGSDGLQAIAVARAAVGRGLPALVVSGDVSAAARERVAAAGFTLVEKPVPPLKLRALVTRALIQR
jgi:CheY-like chemotaxis protein/anti-sigma regulatory factor (Ser/Thr protein kinase)